MKHAAFWNPFTHRKPAYCYILGSSPIPAIGAAAHVADPLAYVKLFDPTGSWSWYLTEANPETGEAFGLVKGFETELGYIDLNELADTPLRFGLRIERDLHFTPRPLSEIRATLDAGRHV